MEDPLVSGFSCEACCRRVSTMVFCCRIIEPKEDRVKGSILSVGLAVSKNAEAEL